MRAFFVAVALCGLPAAAWGAKFGGFSQDGGKYLDGDTKVCTPIAAVDDGSAIGTPACERVTDKKELAGYAFRKPHAAKAILDGKLKLAASFNGKTIELKGTGEDGKDIVLARWDGGQDIDSLGDLYPSDDASLVALDYTTNGLRGKLPATVAFNIRRPLDAAAGVPAKPAAGDKPKPAAGNAYDRAMKHGGVWEQPLVPCDTAKITLKLKKDKSFTIRVETRCQGDKRVQEQEGKWVPDGDDTVALTFENDGETGTEQMACTLGQDAGEDTLTCGDEDVTFIMKPVHR